MGASTHAKTPTTARGNDEGWLGLTAASAAAQPTDRVTVDAGQDEGGAFVFAQVNATEDGSTGAGGGAFVRPESGGVNTDADAGAAVNDEFTGAGVGAFASPFFVGAGAGGGTELVGDEDGTGGGELATTRLYNESGVVANPD